MNNASNLAFASEQYLRAKAVWKGIPYRRSSRALRTGVAKGSQPYDRGRDPKPVGDVLTSVAHELGWSMTLSQATVIEDWATIVGTSTASHTEVLHVENGVLTVRCDSTAWTTELRRLRPEIITQLTRDYPDAKISDVKFIAPGAPTWRHGVRTVKGRGPRDTYG